MPTDSAPVGEFGAMTDLATSSTRQLWILRHAKAGDAPPGGRDRDRPLTERGRRDAEALGDALVADGSPFTTQEFLRPDTALCSSAVRTVETADLVLGRLSDQIPLDSYSSLYEADSDTVLLYLREVEESARSVLVVGHNPTMFQFIWNMVVEGSDDRVRLEERDFPTCALAIVDVAVERWEDVVAGQGKLIGLFEPPY